MIHIDFTPEQIDALHHERFHHPHPRVQLKMEAVYLKSQGLPHQDICRLARISENTLRSLPAAVPGGRRRAAQADRLGRDRAANWPSTARRWRSTSATTRPARPPRPPPRSSGSPASDAGLTQVRKFLKGMGLKFRKLGMIPAKADADEQARVPRRAAPAPAAAGPAAPPGGLLRRRRPLRPRGVPGLPLVLRAAADPRPLGPQAVQRPGGDRRGHARVDDGRQRHGRSTRRPSASCSASCRPGMRGCR